MFDFESEWKFPIKQKSIQRFAELIFFFGAAIDFRVLLLIK